MSTLVFSLILLCPMVISGILHMVVVKTHFFSSFARPIWANGFGPNKTYRGFIMMPLLSVLGVFLTQFIESALPLSLQLGLARHSPWVLGGALGIGYALFELPNSYMKRKLQVPAGKLHPRHPFFFAFIDQADSVVGCLIVYLIFFPITPVLFLLSFFLGTGIHLALNFLLYKFKLRKNAL